jgi:hypothetical protein
MVVISVTGMTNTGVVTFAVDGAHIEKSDRATRAMFHRWEEGSVSFLIKNASHLVNDLHDYFGTWVTEDKAPALLVSVIQSMNSARAEASEEDGWP